MRETWARRIAILTGGLVVVLALLFARHQNPPARTASNAADEPHVSKPVDAQPLPAPHAMPEQAAAPSIPDPILQAGQAVYASQACARCHSIAGRGGGRSALDGVGSRLSDAEIRAWVTPTGQTTGFRERHAMNALSTSEREALVAYLRSLR